MTKMTEVAAFIHKEMKQNLEHGMAKRIKSLNEPSLLASLGTGGGRHIAEGMGLWAAMVGSGKKWDHKGPIKKKFGLWCYDAETDHHYNFDIWSNIHYGYLGKYVGFGDWTLKAGAGAAQLKAGTNPPGYWKRRKKKIGDADVLAAFDDPKDQMAIILGIQLWKKTKKGLSLGQLVEAVRDVCTQLNTETGRYAAGQCRAAPTIPPQLRLQPKQSYLQYSPLED